jgi:hypothetical protein
MNRIKKIEQKLLIKIYGEKPGYRINFKWHIWIPRLIILLPFLVLSIIYDILGAICAFYELIADKLTKKYGEFYIWEKIDD